MWHTVFAWFSVIKQIIYVIKYERDACGRNSFIHLKYIYPLPILDLTHIVLGTGPTPWVKKVKIPDFMEFAYMGGDRQYIKKDKIYSMSDSDKC